MGSVIVYRTAEGAAALLVPAPGHDVADLATTLPEGAAFFTVDTSEIPPVGIAGLDVDFDSETVTQKPPNLEALKASALVTVREIAQEIRGQIAASAPVERSLNWVLKAVYGAAWKANETAANPALAPFSAIAEAGFKLETDLTGEDPVTVRDRSLEKAAWFFHANQLVEGMERLAEDRIPAATDTAELEIIITQLRELETQARSNLETLNDGGNSSA
jgi:hypothetical protein